MLRILTLTAALAGLALPAAAETTVTVNVAGLDAKAAHERIAQAAHSACIIEMRGASLLDQYYTHADCIDRAITRAEASWQSGQASVQVQSKLASR